MLEVLSFLLEAKGQFGGIWELLPPIAQSNNLFSHLFQEHVEDLAHSCLECLAATEWKGMRAELEWLNLLTLL